MTLAGVATAWARVEGLTRRGFARVADGVAAGLEQALSPAEQAEASIAIYDHTAGRTAIFDWEQAWWRAELPPPPATVLVTGAGAGVEAAALARMGYVVDAAEPAPALCARLRQHPVRQAWQADHLGALRAARQDSTRYGAVLFGWGSFTCLLDPADHLACLQAAAQVTDGPILLSCWLADTAGERPTHRLARGGRRVGGVIGRLRGQAGRPQVRFRAWCGFGYVFSRGELQALAARADRTLACIEAPYPHLTLRSTESALPSNARPLRSNASIKSG